MEKEISDELLDEKVPYQHSYTVTLSQQPNSKKPNRVYNVNVIYIPTSEETAKIKRSIVEGIIKKTFMK